jgi:hypothetical protein
MRVLRGMLPDRDGLPRVGNTGSKLGVRPGYAEDEIHPEDRIRPEDSIRPDIQITTDGMVYPGTGGMSATIPPVANMPPHRRPPKHGGDESARRYEVYELETDDLPADLRLRLDPRGPERHAYIEPAREVGFEAYQQALHSTRTLWRVVQ